MKGVMESAVIGVRDTVLGKKLKLFVTLIPSAKISSKEVMRFCRERLPAYSIPKEVVIMDSLPKNSFGKIDKRTLASVLC
jgi:long-chain acyl-CoA synthetase